MIDFFSKRWFQGICSSVHIVSAITLFIAFADESIVGTTGHFKIYMQTTHQNNMTPVEVGDLSLFLLLGMFSLVTSMFHVYYYFNSNDMGDYSYDGAIRFLEYSVTASIMFISIAILVGIVDLYTLIAIFFLSVSTMLFGYTEEHSVTVRDYPYVLRPFFLGCYPYIAAWVILFIHFLRVGGNVIPWFVYVIFVGEFILFSCFAAISYFYVVKPGKVVSPKEMNGWYNILSLISKSLLVWFTFGGVVARG